MSERSKPHNGRDKSGHFKVKQADVEDLRTEPDGEKFLRDDVRLGGAIENTDLNADNRKKHIGDLVEKNREDVEQSSETD